MPADNSEYGPAVVRAIDMMGIPMKDLPPLALEFCKRLAGQLGLCMEVCITAYACYAQAVEGLECYDDLYRIRPEHSQWFTDKMKEHQGSGIAS